MLGYSCPGRSAAKSREALGATVGDPRLTDVIVRTVKRVQHVPLCLVGETQPLLDEHLEVRGHGAINEEVARRVEHDQNMGDTFQTHDEQRRHVLPGGDDAPVQHAGTRHGLDSQNESQQVRQYEYLTKE